MKEGLARTAVIMAQSRSEEKEKVLICPPFKRVRSWHKAPWQSFHVSHPAEPSRTMSSSLTAGASSALNLSAPAKQGKDRHPAAARRTWLCPWRGWALLLVTWHPLIEHGAVIFPAALPSSRDTRVGWLKTGALPW